MSAGDTIARIYDVYGDEVGAIAAPADGMIFGLRCLPSVMTGDWCCLYTKLDGTWDDQGRGRSSPFFCARRSRGPRDYSRTSCSGRPQSRARATTRARSSSSISRSSTSRRAAASMATT